MSTALTTPATDARPASSATTPTAPSSVGFTPPRGVYRRIARRETHSTRSMPAIVLAVALILVLAWIGTEIVIALLGAPALLVAPVDMFTSAVNLVEAPAGIVAAAGIVVAVIGLALVIVAVSPGRRARHLIESSRTVRLEAYGLKPGVRARVRVAQSGRIGA